MQQTEILSLTERLIPAYHSSDFEQILDQMTQGKPPATKLLVKMELNRRMTPCNRNIDLRGRVAGTCREYELDGITHWLDDIAFNDYHRYMKRYGSFTDGVWEALYNTKNNFRVMRQRGVEVHSEEEQESRPFEVEAIPLGYDLKRKENRLRVSSQVSIKLADNQKIYGVTSDLSPSGARFKVPNAYDYGLGDVIEVQFSELSKKLDIEGIEFPVTYRVLGIEDVDETNSVKHLRTMKQDDSDLVKKIITESLHNDAKRARHDNQDKIVRARTRAYEHTFLKHACQLPVFFSDHELKAVLLTESNQEIWQYWHDERNQQTLGAMFNHDRMSLLAKPGVKGSSNTIYSFKHQHQDKTLFFSMMMPEASPEVRKLFWHLGAKRDSWRVFRISIFELSAKERSSLESEQPELTNAISLLTHYGLVQEIGNSTTANDYLLVDKPNLHSNAIAPFRQPRAIKGHPISIFFDARPQRKEPRYFLRSPLEISLSDTEQLQGQSIDLSKRGLSIELEHPVELKVGRKVNIDFKELKLYNKQLPLHKVTYRIVRISPNGKTIQLVIVDDSWTVKIVHFFTKLIDTNLDKLTELKEVLPSDTLLENLHHIMLARIKCYPIFVERHHSTLHTRAIGVNHPLEPCIMLLAKLGHNEKISLEPIFKGHTNSLLLTPMKHIDGAKPQYNEVYMAVHRFGNRIRAVDVRLHSDFENVKQRIAFIEEGKILGDVYILQLSGMPVFHPLTALLRRDLSELVKISSHHAKSIEKEIGALTGYGEIIDITDEVLTRLELHN